MSNLDTSSHHDLGYHDDDPKYYYWCELCAKGLADKKKAGKAFLETVMFHLTNDSLRHPEHMGALEEMLRHDIEALG